MQAVFVRAGNTGWSGRRRHRRRFDGRTGEKSDGGHKRTKPTSPALEQRYPDSDKTGSDRMVGTRSKDYAVAQNGRSSTSAAVPLPNEPPSAGISDGSGASAIGG